MTNRLLPLWGAALLVTGCFQALDTGADKETNSQPQDQGPSTVVLPSEAPIETTSADDASAQTTQDACEKTRQDKTEILTAYCAKCHSGPGAQGLPPFDFILDDKKLVSSVWMRSGQPDQRFVIPGDPDHSVLYIRASSDMPPIPTDVRFARDPTPTASDLSVLRQWIAHCL